MNKDFEKALALDMLKALLDKGVNVDLYKGGDDHYTVVCESLEAFVDKSLTVAISQASKYKPIGNSF